MILKKKTLMTKTPVDTPKETSSPSETPTPLQRVIRPDVLKHEGDSMRGLFFIVKGHYRKGVEPSFISSVNNDEYHVGGFNPEDPNTDDWYMCLDKTTYHCVSCGSDLNKVLKGVYKQILQYKGSAKKYFKHISDTTSDDYYETHYLGQPPLTDGQRTKKAEGRCPRTSPAMRCLYNAVYDWYGDHYSDLVQDMEDKAYKDLEEVIKNSKPINRTRKIMKKTPVQKMDMDTPKTPAKGVVNTSKKIGKVKTGVKKLALG